MRVKEKEVQKKEVQQKECKVEHPHAHDVLCGRGHSVNSHPGNVFYRSLVKRRIVEYAEAPKVSKPRIAMIIYREIRLRDPPGRFLKLDAESKLWLNIGDHKAIGKTRQALREGGQLTTKNIQNFMEEGETLLYNSLIERQSNVPDGRRHSLPSQASSNSSASKLNRTEERIREDSMLNGIVSIAASDNDNEELTTQDYNESITDSASSVIDSKWITLNSSTLTNSVQKENSMRFNNVSPDKFDDAVGDISDYFMNNSNKTNITAVNSLRESCDTIFNGITPKIAQRSGFLQNDSLGNSVTSIVPLLSAKRPRGHDSSKGSNKKQHTFTPNETFSSTIKESVGVAALIAMSNGGDNEKTKDGSFVKKSGLTNDGFGNDQGNRVSPLASHEMQIIKNQPRAKQSSCDLPSSLCNNLMPCDTCLGTGTLPIPNSAMRSQCGQSIEPSTYEDSIIVNLKVIPSTDDKSRNFLTTRSGHYLQTVNRPNTLLEDSSSWIERICKAEQIWGIPSNDSIQYPERIKAIEKKSNEYERILKSVDALHSSFEISERAQRVLEETERKWGLKPLEDQTNAERIELIEQAVSLHKLRQEEQKWGLTPTIGHTCEERAALVNQTAATYMNRLKSLL